MNEILDLFKEGSPAAILTGLLIGVGYLLKYCTPALRSKEYIPWVLVSVGAGTYPFMIDYSDTVLNMRYPMFMCSIQGALFGLAASKIYDKFLKKDENEKTSTTVVDPGTH